MNSHGKQPSDSRRQGGAHPAPPQADPNQLPAPHAPPSQAAAGIAQAGGISADPAVEAAARFQQMQRALMGFDLREALKQSPVLNPQQTPSTKALS